MDKTSGLAWPEPIRYTRIMAMSNLQDNTNSSHEPCVVCGRAILPEDSWCLTLDNSGKGHVRCVYPETAKTQKSDADNTTGTPKDQPKTTEVATSTLPQHSIVNAPTSIQGVAEFILLCRCITTLACFWFGISIAGGEHLFRRWDYQVLYAPAVGPNGEPASRTTAEASLATTTVLNSDLQKKLDELSRDGWELVGACVEEETAFPNFGKDEYVNGIRENVRPQGLILMFKRRAWNL